MTLRQSALKLHDGWVNPWIVGRPAFSRALPVAAGCPSKRRPAGGGLRAFVRVSPFKVFVQWCVAGWDVFSTLAPRPTLR